MQLQKVLVACLNHKIDRGEAQALTVGVCFQKITNSGTLYACMFTQLSCQMKLFFLVAVSIEEEQMSLVECLAGFRKAWKLVKERLPHHR